jgi:hypothetical protein
MTTETDLPLAEYRTLWEFVVDKYPEHARPRRMDGRPIVLGRGITRTINGKQFGPGIYRLDSKGRDRIGRINDD